MSIIDRTLSFIKERKAKIRNGGINSIQSPFIRFLDDFLGVEQQKYYVVTGSTKAAKTSAEPVSCCSRIRPAGTSIIAAAIRRPLELLIFTSMLPTYLARASAVANLANSDGCSRKNPRSIHDLPPLTVTARKSVNTSNPSAIAYMM